MSVRVRVWPFLTCAVVLTALLAGAYLFFVASYTGQIVDERAKAGAVLGNWWFAHLADRFLGVVPLLCLGGGVVLVVVIGFVRRTVGLTALALAVIVGANVTTQVLKRTLSRPDTGATWLYGNSFPSGHATVAASVVLAVFLVVAPRLRPLVAALGAAFTVGVGMLLLASQWHRPSDIVAGILVAAIWGCLAGALAARLGWWAPAHHVTRHPVALWLLAVACGAASALAFAQIYATASEHGSHLTVAFAGGLAAIAAAGAASAATVTRLFRGVA